ncbi:MAG: hypothetical protein KA248_15350 [Kiritimatiellae bacterium]|nr:hypothetical protein [Kiritimatiellia bacterium]
MKRSILVVTLALGMCGMMTGCDGNGEDGYGLDSFSATGIDPETGAYSFSQEGHFAVIVDWSTGIRSLRFSRDGFRFDNIPIQNGTFFMEHGEVNGTDCPTDGYAISGHFVTSTRAEGRVAYATDCEVTSRQDFTAQR